MKVGLILAGNIWFAPYMNIYTQILDKLGVEYDVISWNRDGKDPQKGYQYNERYKMKGRLSKFVPYIRYASFVKKIVKNNRYDRLIVFGPHIGIFLSNFLRKNYSKRYLFDYRDLSIEQLPIFKSAFKQVLKNSCVNVLSSFGYKKVLPKDFDYVLSHNFNIDTVREALVKPLSNKLKKGPIKILTIGGIRNYEANMEVVKSLENKGGFEILFVGKGEAGELIKEYADKNAISNLSYVGYYPKEKEASYVQDSTLLNIYFPKVVSHSTILSNRLYLALIHKKPMLVTSNSTQGDYVEKYQLGLSLDNCENLDKKIVEYLATLDYEAFSKRCNELLENFVADYEVLEKKVIEFVKE